MVNFDVFIPVRLSNTRLPNKAMKLVDEKPIILHLIERLQNSKKIRNVVVCTTTNEFEEPLLEHIRPLNNLIKAIYAHSAKNNLKTPAFSDLIYPIQSDSTKSSFPT